MASFARRFSIRFDPAIPDRPRAALLYYVGPLLLFIAAAGDGILEIRPQNDTWIGLAAGRQILSMEQVPQVDTFSYTVAGKPWYNQNWLTHVLQYWLYEHVSHDAVIYAHWLTGFAIFFFVALAAYWRAKNVTGALLTAAVTACGCRYFLSPRAATVGFLCVALQWALICALENRQPRRRYWPIVCLFPLLLFWGNAHGSFVYGYGVLVLYVFHWLALRLLKRGSALSGVQIILLVSVVAVAFGATVIIGPFGIHNFTHGEKVAASSVWRDVVEWQSPFATQTDYPWVMRFWWILAFALVCSIFSVWIRIRGKSRSIKASTDGSAFSITFFDVALTGIALVMTLWARRFIPLFMIYAPMLALMLLLRAAPYVKEAWSRMAEKIICVTAGAGGIALGVTVGIHTHTALVTDYAQSPQSGLLERATMYDLMPQDAFDFISRNELELRLLADWSLAGAVMLHAPSAKVYIDGRAQQVYEEEHYRAYQALFVAPNTPAAIVFHILDASGTDSVLLRNWEHGANLWQILDRSKTWIPVWTTVDERLYLRRGSTALKRLGALMHSGTDWWPGEITRLVGSGFVWQALAEPDQASAAWKSAMSRRLGSSQICIRPLTETLIEAGRANEAAEFLNAYQRRVESAVDLDADLRNRLLQAVADAKKLLGRGG